MPEKTQYKADNLKAVKEVVMPAYTRLADCIKALKGTSTNNNGLCAFDGGKEYFNNAIRIASCGNLDAEACYTLLDNCRVDLTTSMVRAITSSPKVLSDHAYGQTWYQPSAESTVGRMYADAYKDMGLHPKTLSNALESAGTVTSALVPWNTCGVYILGVLGVSTFEYFPYAVFNILTPIVTLVMAFMGITIADKEGKRFFGKGKHPKIDEL